MRLPRRLEPGEGGGELDAEATEDCRQTECRPCVSRSSRVSRQAGNLDFF